MFDIKVYDVTEIDAIAFEDPEAECYKRDEDKSETADTRDAEAQTITTNNVSILRRLLQLDPQCAFQIIAFAPVRRVIDEKWNAYRRFFYPWLVFHVVYMSFLTWYATARSLQKAPINGTIDEPDFINPILEKSSTLAPGIINIAVGVVYLAEAGLRYFLQRMPVTRISIDNPYSNLAFRLFFILFGLSLITDFICAAVINWYENYMLMLAVAIGWFLMLFFLRAFRQFSFFTVMIQNVLLGDLLRFSVIIFFELVAFSTVMFMALQGAIETDSEYIHYGRVFLSMFKLMVGLGDVGLIYQTRHPGLVIFILVGFIILTTILMINSLIAMISRTSTELVEGLGVASALDFHWKLQRLSLVLYIESILHNRSVHRGGSKKEKKWYSNRTNAREKMDRYCLEIRSLQNADKVLRSRDAGLDMKLLFSEYYRMFKSGNDKVEHHDETSTNMNEKYPTIDEECSAKSVSGLHLQPMVGGERKLDVIHHYDHCDNCDKMAEDNKNVNDGLEESA